MKLVAFCYLLLTSIAFGQTPTPCVPRLLTKILVSQSGSQSVEYLGCAGTEAEAVATGAAMAAAEAASAADDAGLASFWSGAAGRLAAIQQQSSALEAQAVAMESLTLSGTTAQQLVQLRNALREVATAIKLQARMHADEAQALLYLGRIAKRQRGIP